MKIFNRLCGARLYIVVQFEEPFSVATPFAMELSRKLSSILDEHNAVAITERWFGSRGMLPAMGILPAQTGITSIVNPPCIENIPVAGCQIEALVKDKISSLEPVENANRCVGVRWKESDCDFARLCGLDARNLKSDNPCDQTDAVLDDAVALLETCGMTYHDVVRTWFYLNDILSWYDDFNKTRSAYYRKLGIMPDITKSDFTPPEQCYLPASTGIRGANLADTNVTLDLIAMRGTGGRVRRLTNSKQKDAFRYGAAFSRATAIEMPGATEVQISGTAAIDETGASVFLNNPEAQIRCTLDTIENLIADANCSLQNICSATAFLKHKEYYPLLKNILKERGLENLPVVITVADVCRDNLLFEMDGIACR